MEFLEDPAHAPHHPLTAALGALYLTLRHGAVPGPADVPVLDLNALEPPLFTSFARFSVPPWARIGMVSRRWRRPLWGGVDVRAAGLARAVSADV